MCLLLRAVQSVATCFLPTDPQVNWPAACTGISPGDVCTGTCAAGFIGLKAATCLANGTYSEPNGTCVSNTQQGELAQLKPVCLLLFGLAWCGM